MVGNNTYCNLFTVSQYLMFLQWSRKYWVFAHHKAHLFWAKKLAILKNSIHLENNCNGRSLIINRVEFHCIYTDQNNIFGFKWYFCSCLDLISQTWLYVLCTAYRLKFILNFLYWLEFRLWVKNAFLFDFVLAPMNVWNFNSIVYVYVYVILVYFDYFTFLQLYQIN